MIGYVSKRQDGTFEILKNGYGYQVLPDDDLYAGLVEEYAALLPGYAVVDGVVMEDHRNMSGWLNDERFTMRDFGPLPGGFTTTPPLLVRAAEFDAKVLARMNAFAKTRQYDSMDTCISRFQNSHIPAFASEAAYLKTVYAEISLWCGTYMSAVFAGEKPVPTWEQFEAELDAAYPLVWPVDDIRTNPPLGSQ